MPVAPDGRPTAAFEATMTIPRFERAPRRRGNRPGGMTEFVVQLALAGDPRNRRVAGIPLDRLGGDRPTAIQLTGRRARRPGQGVDTCPDDQLRPRTRSVLLAASAVTFAA